MSDLERITTTEGLRAAVSAARFRGDRIGLVPTMGSLHVGHLSLVEMAADHADTVVVSIFVNPTQFDRSDDLATYPRDLAGDEAALAGLGSGAPAIVFAPTVDEMYPRPPRTTVHVAGLTDHLCGATRPGHFDGVATVVTKLLHLATPDVAVFGRKDFQQLQVIRRLVADLDLSVRIVDAPTSREPDGLARASRNRRLTPTDRDAARVIPLALRAAVLAAQAARATGRDPDPAVLRASAGAVLATVPSLDLDYLEVVDAATLAPVTGPPTPDRGLLVAVAAALGSVRLIDNVEVGHADDERRLLEATA